MFAFNNQDVLSQRRQPTLAGCLELAFASEQEI